MTSVTHPIFSYRPLIEQDAIRLILLHPAPTISAELECSIEHVTLSQYKQDLINHYTALSYVWGDSTDRRQILVNRCSFHITSNLESALRHLRDASRVLRVWADGLCINQSDIAERNQQVQQMSSIYSTAQHTVIYLGDASVKSDSVFSGISSLHIHNDSPLSLALLASKCDDATLEILYEGIETQILTKPWFFRVWIFQELLLSRDPWVQCGTKRLKWADLYLVSVLAGDRSRRSKNLKDELEDWGDGKIITTVDLSRGVGALGRLEDMHLARRKFQDYTSGNGTGNTLLALLELRRGLGVSDPRDMIYAHLGLASDAISGNLGFKVDYTKSCLQLFIEITQYFLEKHKDYRILSHVEDVDPLRRRLGLPSWVPDWTSNKANNLHEKTELYSLETPTTFSISLSAEGKYQLACRGSIFGKVKSVGANVLSFTHLSSDEIKKSWANLLVDSGNQPRPSSFGERYRRRKKSFEVLVEEVAKAAGFQCSSSFRTCLSKSEHYWNESLSNCVRLVGGTTAQAEINLHPIALVSSVPFYFFPLNDMGRATRHSRPDLSADLGVLEGRRLCLYTDLNDSQEETGREVADSIALVPQSTQIEDVICGFDGDSRLFVLRPITDHGFSKEGTNRHFALVGMCYCDALYGSRLKSETLILE